LEEVRSSMHAEIAELRVEKDATRLELQTSQASIRNLEVALQTQNVNIAAS
jgi:hypothetical protein